MLSERAVLVTQLGREECAARINASAALRGGSTPRGFVVQRRRAIRNGLARFARGRFVTLADGTPIELRIGPPRGAVVAYGAALLVPAPIALATGAWWLLLLVPFGGALLAIVGLVLWRLGGADTAVLLDALTHLLDARRLADPD